MSGKVVSIRSLLWRRRMRRCQPFAWAYLGSLALMMWLVMLGMLLDLLTGKKQSFAEVAQGLIEWKTVCCFYLFLPCWIALWILLWLDEGAVKTLRRYAIYAHPLHVLCYWGPWLVTERLSYFLFGPYLQWTWRVDQWRSDFKRRLSA
ncbi:MAG: hypothetical protein H6760_03615 [Candidatus Nomurabacteria bacterium]|nr:MAG: hypothetical protein H6760_03615 [Candidatus Nomurabacteria bacterium]